MVIDSAEYEARICRTGTLTIRSSPAALRRLHRDFAPVPASAAGAPIHSCHRGPQRQPCALLPWSVLSGCWWSPSDSGCGDGRAGNGEPAVANLGGTLPDQGVEAVWG